MRDLREPVPGLLWQSRKKFNPVLGSDLLRSVYKKRQTVSEGIGHMVGARDYQLPESEEWVEDSYSCTGCRRCAPARLGSTIR